MLIGPRILCKIYNYLLYCVNNYRLLCPVFWNWSICREEGQAEATIWPSAFKAILREASSWRRGPGNEVRFGLRSHALLDTLSTAETTELSGPGYLWLPANTTQYHRKQLTLRVFRAELAIYCCANYFESYWTHKCGKPAHLEVANHLFYITRTEYNEITYLTVKIQGH